MAGTPNAMATIIALAFSLSVGILLVILSGALYSNWLPLIVVFVYILAPLPNIICKRLSGDGDFYSDDNNSGILETGYFITSIVVVSGIGLPVVLAHSGAITVTAMFLSLIGGVMIYFTILGYLKFFVTVEDGAF